MMAASLGSSCARSRVGAPSRSNDARRTSCATSGHGSLVAPIVVVERELVERRALREVREREQPLHRQRALGHDAVQIGHEAAARVEAAVADGERQQLRQQLPEAAAVVGVERFRAAVGKDRDRVGGDDVDAVEQHRGSLAPQVVLGVSVPRVDEG